MMEERGIEEEWVLRAVQGPDKVQEHPDGSRSYLKAVVEVGGRYLRVVVNPAASPNRVITVYFDKRLGRKA
jgi:hypothetical protein